MVNNKKDKRLFVKDAARLLQRSPETIRRWDNEGLFAAKRDRYGHRFYTELMIKRFRAQNKEMFE